MAQVILFSGLDGAGKSTQIDRLKDYYLNKNERVYCFWSRGGYTPGFQKLKNTIRKILKNKLPKAGKSQEREASFGNPLIRKIWLFISIVDLIFYYSFFLRIKLLCGYNIVCDRFILDTNVDFNIAYPNENVENWILWKILVWSSIKPNHHFLLLISVKESMKRSLLKDEPFPDTMDTLKKRLSLYELFSKENKYLHTIWCNKSVNVITKQIIENLK